MWRPAERIFQHQHRHFLSAIPALVTAGLAILIMSHLLMYCQNNDVFLPMTNLHGQGQSNPVKPVSLKAGRGLIRHQFVLAADHE
jgi:hypothetical protein